MVERLKAANEIFTSKLLFIFFLKLQSVTSIINHSCYTCIEPLVGYTDYTDSCRFFNQASPIALSYVQSCRHNDAGYTGEYECRKLVISYRSVETYLRRDCVPKGLCSWKDKTQAMIHTPASNCVYTDDNDEKVECIYCCDTPLCNRTMSYQTIDQLTFWLLVIWSWRTCHFF